MTVTDDTAVWVNGCPHISTHELIQLKNKLNQEYWEFEVVLSSFHACGDEDQKMSCTLHNSLNPQKTQLLVAPRKLSKAQLRIPNILHFRAICI